MPMNTVLGEWIPKSDFTAETTGSTMCFFSQEPTSFIIDHRPDSSDFERLRPIW